MASAKEQALEMLSSLPDDCSFEQIRYGLYVRERIEKGLADADAQRGISHDEVGRRLMERIAPWRESSGQSPQ